MNIQNVIYLCTSSRSQFLLIVGLFFTLSGYGQSHTFPNVNPGTITSGTSGITTALSTGGVSGDYLYYEVTADFIGIGGAQTAWSNSIEMQLIDGSVIFADTLKATCGKMANSNATTLHWTGVLKKKYIGGNSLSIRFRDDYHDGSGPYTSSISNVSVTICQPLLPQPFTTIAGPINLSSNVAGGVNTALSTSGVTGDYLFYEVTADFIGTGGVQAAWSNSIDMILNNGAGVNYSDTLRATCGKMANSNATTLHWTGVLNKKYIGGNNLSVRFRDDYHDAMGPYTSTLTNVNINLFEPPSPQVFNNAGPINLSSNVAGGVNTALSTGGVTGDYLFYEVTADFVGTGGDQAAWSNSIDMILNNGAGVNYSDTLRATCGKMVNSNATTLHWTGVLNKKYIGGNNLSVRFRDDFHDAMGPYTSTLTNAVVTIFQCSAIPIVCPTVGAVSASKTSLCVNDLFNVTATGLMGMDGVTNMEQDFGIKFAAFTSTPADPYVGGTSLGTVPFGSLGGGTTASLTGATLGTAGSYEIYAILSPTPTDATCRPSAMTTLTVDSPATTAAAGTDQTNCNNGSFTLAGNVPMVGTGSWSVIAGTANIATPTAANSGVTGVPAGSSATLRWTIDPGNSCPNSTDDVILTNDSPATTAVAGPDQTNCNNGSFNLEGNAPLPFSGMWTEVGGPTGGLVIASPSSPTSMVSGVPSGGSVTLRWSIASGNSCPNSENDVVLTNNTTSAIVIANPASTAATQLLPFSRYFIASGGTPTYTFSTSSILPSGLSFTSSGLLHGTPTMTGVFPITVDVIDAGGCTASSIYNLTISAGTIGVARWVSNTGGTRPAQVTVNCNDYNTVATTYTTIQSAISAAGNGDVVYITDGTYANPSINTNCIIAGVNAGNQINVSSKTNLIITSSTGNYCNSNAIITGYGFEIIDGNNVTIQGLKLENVPANAFYNSNAGFQTNNVTIHNNWVLNTYGHGVKTDDHPSDGVIDRSIWEISGNKFENIGSYNPDLCALRPVSGIWLAQAGYNFNIFDNIITNTRWAGILCVGQGRDNAVASTEIATISGNRIDQTVDAGIQIGFSAGAFYYSNGANITHNTITNANTSNKVGIGGITILQNNIYGVSITHNDVSSSFNGLAIEMAGWANSPDMKSIINNNFYNLSGGFGVTHIAGIPPNGLFMTGDDLYLYNFRNNYWGDPTGPTYVTNPGGIGEGLKKDANSLGSGTYSLNDYLYLPFLPAPATVNSVVECFGILAVCPTIGAVSASETNVCQDGLFNVTATGLLDMDNVTNMVQDFGIEFVAFTSTPADPYVGGTSLGTVAFGSLTDGGATAALVGASLSTAGSYEIYAILSPASSDCACQPFVMTTITVDSPATTAAAGADQVNCNNGSFTLAGNVPTVGTGSWSVFAGTATITSPTAANSGVTGVPAGSTATLRWTIDPGNSCPNSTDDVMLTNDSPATTAAAGTDQVNCNNSSFTLAGNVPTVGTGSWSVFAGTANITTSTAANSGVTGVPAGSSATLRWTIDPGNSCPNSIDDVMLTNDSPATTAAAGIDQVNCNNGSFTLAGNVPTVGTGSWSVFAGTANITTSTAANSGVTGVPAGSSATLRWTIDPGNSCPNSTDDVILANDSPATAAAAGIDQVKCNNGSFTLAGNVPTVGTGSWSVLAGTATITSPTAANSGVTGVPAGSTATLRWTIDPGNSCPNSTDDVMLTNDSPATTAAAGTDQVNCNNGSFTLAGNVPTVGTGSWSVFAGTANITTSTAVNSGVTGVPAGSSATLRWTIDPGNSCPNSIDDVMLTNDSPATTAAAGTDQVNCNNGSFTLAGNVPTVGTGSWSVFAGTATITSPTAANPGVTGVPAGSSATLRWTIDPGNSCPNSTDDVMLTNDSPATTAAAGTDQVNCNNGSFTLAGNVPTVGTGSWSVFAGTANITTSTAANSGVTGVPAGSTATLRWTIDPGNSCPNSTDDVMLTNDSPATAAAAGIDQTMVCNGDPTTIVANTPLTGTGEWSEVTTFGVTIASPLSSSTTVSGFPNNNTVTLRWTITNGSCSSFDDVDITTITCCVLEVSCPPISLSTIECGGDIPDAAENEMEFEAIGGIIEDDPGYCGTLSITHMDEYLPPTDICMGSTLTRTYTVSDDNNSVTCTQTLEISPPNPPRIMCPGDVTVDCDAPTDPANTGGMATGTGDCSQMVNISFADELEAATDGYIINRTWKATDDCMRETICVQMIKVVACEVNITDPCVCLDNASVIDVDAGTGGDDGQFSELVSITGPDGGPVNNPNLEFQVIGSTGGVDAFVALPQPGMQTAGNDNLIGAPLVWNMTTMHYELPFYHYDEAGYSITIRQIVGGLQGQEFTIDNICRYPNPVFDPSVPDDICPTSPDFVFGGFDANGEDADDVTFEVDGMPAIDFDPQEMEPGTYIITMIFDGGEDEYGGISPDGIIPAAPGCTQIVQKTLELREPVSDMTCIGSINISISSDCTLELYSELFFKDDAFRCYDDYIIKVNGEVESTIEEIGTYTITIEDPVTGNSCWSEITVEDKIGPTFPEMCPREDPCAYRCTDFNTETRLIDGVAILTESDLIDCSGVTLFGPYLVFKSAEECSAPDTVIYHYTAKDENGYTSEKDYYYIIEQLSIGKFEFPGDYEGSCSAAGANLSPSAINSYPLYEGVPADFLIFDTDNTALACNIVVNYMDIKQVITCGDDPGCALNRKVIREWTIIDWCAVDNDTEPAILMETQLLDLKDTEAPTIKGPEEMTVSTDPWKCAAEFEIVIDAKDNCATDDALTYTLLGPVGVSIVGNGQVFSIKHAPPTYDDPHIFTAYAEDCCGNISDPFEIEVWIRDEVKPIAVAVEFTVASITNVDGEDDDIVKVYWQSIDNGSWDACSDLEYYVRRMDGDPDDCDKKDFFPYDYDDEEYTRDEAISLYYDEVECRTAEIQDDFVIPLKLEGPNIDDKYDYGAEICNTGLIPYNGDEWGEYAKFCCADLNSNADDADIDGDGLKNEHRVELIVFDQAGNWNITWGWVKVEDPNPPILEIKPYETFCHDEILSGSYTAMLENIKAEAKKLVTATGACEIDLTDLVVQGELKDECWDPSCKFGSGTIAYSIISPKGGIVRGTQEYTIYYKDDFACDDIHGWTYDLDDPWYDDANNYDFRDNLDADCMSPVPENLTWDAGPCALIGWNMVSDTFQFETDACVKVINTWTVIDWCVYEYTKEETDFEETQKFYDHWFEFLEYGVPRRIDDPRPMEARERSCDSYYHLDHDGDLDYIDDDVDKPHWFSGVYTWTQVIKVTDEIAPEIVPFEDDMLTDSILVNCEQGITVELTAEDTGDCPAVLLKWSLVEIDKFGGIITDDNYARKVGTTVVYNLGDFTGPMETRYYRALTWDGCGNTDTYEFKYTLIDVKAPTPYCINLSSALMVDPDGEEGAMVAMVELWACDFDRGSFDNCTDDGDLYFTFDGVPPGIGNVGDDELIEKEQYYSANGLLTYDRDESPNASNWRNSSGGAMDIDRLDEIRMAYLTGLNFEGAEVYRWLPADQSACRKYTAGKVFTEDELAIGDTDGDGNVDVRMDVWDRKLNVDYCDTELTLRCQNECNNTYTIDLVGTISTESSKAVSNVIVTLMNLNNPESLLSQITDIDGAYAFTENPINQDYSISGLKVDAADEGVSTLDLVIIQRHILGLNTFESPYKVIASDINNNGNLNATDLIVLRKVILGIYEEFPDNTSWKFVDASQELAVETALSEYRETIDLKNVDANMMNEDFVAVKVGDVNGDARTNARDSRLKVRNARKVALTMEDRQVEKGEAVEIVFGSAQFDEVYGFQFTFEFAGLRFSELTAGEANLSSSNIAMKGEQAMAVSYDNSNGISASDNLFTLTMEATQSGTLGEMVAITGNTLTNEAYVGRNLEVMTMELVVEDPLVADFSLKQNEPNPFDDVTYIGFTLPKAGEAVLTIYDVTGKQVTRIEADFAKGYNEMSIDKSRLVASGVYYYTLKSGQYSATKKMILIE